MDFFSPAMIALYIILASIVVAFLYIAIMGNRLTILQNQAGNPDTFRGAKDRKKDDDAEEEEEKTPVYPQTVQISGYDIEPQPHTMNVSNELVEASVRKVCSIDADTCSF